MRLLDEGTAESVRLAFLPVFYKISYMNRGEGFLFGLVVKFFQSFSLKNCSISSAFWSADFWNKRSASR